MFHINTLGNIYIYIYANAKAKWTLDIGNTFFAHRKICRVKIELSIIFTELSGKMKCEVQGQRVYLQDNGPCPLRGIDIHL
jgi:hypothetical protein